MHVHDVVVDDHDGVMDVHNYCELWMFTVVMDINNLINDVHISAVDVICSCIMGDMSEDLMS